LYCYRFLILVSLIGINTAEAQPFEALGVRALGMAGAFVGVADDATAVYWNPAGLSTGHFFSLLADHSDNSYRQSNNRNGFPKMSSPGTIVGLSTNDLAFSYYRLSINKAIPLLVNVANDDFSATQNDISINTNLVTQNVAFTGSTFVHSAFRVGTTLRYVRGSIGLGSSGLSGSTAQIFDRTDGMERIGQNKFDVDIGLMFGSEMIQIGIIGRNLLQPEFVDSIGRRAARLDRHFRAGIGFRTRAGLLVSSDIDLSAIKNDPLDGQRRNVAVGLEHWFTDWLGIRGGSRVNILATTIKPVGSIGLSLAIVPGIFLDGQFTHGSGSIEESWGIAVRVGF
tara:strand:+ start:5660 stop:6676 length:1017 start_codon:yes stop_codon:yes gene_type:complete